MKVERKRHGIRKVAGVVMLMGLLASLFGCSAKEPKTENMTKPAPTTAAVTKTEAEPEPYELGLKGTEGLGDKAEANPGAVTGFSYSYGAAMAGDDYTIEVELVDGKPVLSYESMEYRDYGRMETEADEALTDALKDLYLTHKVYRWEGYNMVDTNVLDGSGFSLSYKFEDGASMYAHGSNAVPEGYREFKKEMLALFEPVMEELKEKARQEQIAKGLTGIPQDLMANFKQQGKSGYNSYSFFILPADSRERNFDVTINDHTGEFYGPGEVRYWASLPDEAIDFAAIDALVKKYDVLQWYNWDETDPDYMNHEWFQLSIGYEDGNLNAMGTAYPEHYEEFRKELLTLLMDMIEKAKANYGLEEYK